MKIKWPKSDWWTPAAPEEYEEALEKWEEEVQRREDILMQEGKEEKLNDVLNK